MSFLSSNTKVHVKKENMPTLTPAMSWASKIKVNGDKKVFEECEQSNVEREQLLKKAKQDEEDARKLAKQQFEERKALREKTHIETMVDIRGVFWFLHTEGTLDEYNPSKKLDIRRKAAQLRYDYECEEEVREQNEEMEYQNEMKRHAEKSAKEKAEAKARLSPEEYIQWKTDKFYETCDEYDEECWSMQSSYIGNTCIPSEYRRYAIQTGIHLNPVLKPLENEKRNMELKQGGGF